jgi:hypothetical protein
LIRSPWKNRFSALGGTKKGIPVRIIFGKGVANSYTLLSYCIWKGIVKRSSWSTCNWQGVEDKVQGKAALYAWVKANYTSLIEDFYTNASEYIKALAGGFDHGDI